MKIPDEAEEAPNPIFEQIPGISRSWVAKCYLATKTQKHKWKKNTRSSQKQNVLAVDIPLSFGKLLVPRGSFFVPASNCKQDDSSESDA